MKTLEEALAELVKAQVDYASKQVSQKPPPSKSFGNARAPIPQQPWAANHGYQN